MWRHKGSQCFLGFGSEYQPDMKNTKFQKKCSVPPLPFPYSVVLPSWPPSSNLTSSGYLCRCFPFGSQS